MEVVKNRKIKKRRHRGTVIKLKKSIEKSKPEGNNNCENISEETDDSSVDDVTKCQSVQTESAHIDDSQMLLLEKEEEIKNLTDRMQQIRSKLYESKNAYSSLKLEFSKAQKLLCSEIGENVSIAALSSQPGGWRGRAEQIQHLKQKLAELSNKLAENNKSRRKSIVIPTERRSSSSIRMLDKERRQQMDNLSKELKESENLLDNTKKKLEASRARIAVLENEIGASKKTIGLLNEKTIHDNQLIDALHDQLKTAAVKFQEREAAIKKEKDKCEREIVLLKSELEAAQLHLKHFKEQLDEKEKEIESMRIKSGANANKQQQQKICASPTQSPRNNTKDASEYIAIGIAAEAERERLLDLVTVLNRRLDKERNDYEQLSDLYKAERGRAARLDTKVQKMELERVGLSKVNTGYYRMKARLAVASSENRDFADSEETRLKFELLQEECLALKTRLATIQKDKTADLAAFKQMLEQTRKIFKDAYRGKLVSVCSPSSVTV